MIESIWEFLIYAQREDLILPTMIENTKEISKWTD